MYLSQIQKKYKISYIHNPKHFYLNSLYIDVDMLGRKILCGKSRPHHKNYHVLAILVPLHKESNTVKNISVKRVTVEMTTKPFFGILQD